MSLADVESGDPRVHPSKIARGAKFWRWTVIRHAAPEQRAVRRGHFVYQRRVRVRCVCGSERTLFERQILLGRSTGCVSQGCRAKFDAAKATEVREALAQIVVKVTVGEARATAALVSISETLEALRAVLANVEVIASVVETRRRTN